MYIEKNICNNLISTLLNLEGKSKDNLKACLDLKEMGIRQELYSKELANGIVYIPPALYTTIAPSFIYLILHTEGRNKVNPLDDGFIIFLTRLHSNTHSTPTLNFTHYTYQIIFT